MNKNTYTKRASLGKHGIERPSVKKRRKWSVGVVAVALAGLLAVGGTVAWLVSSTGTVTNAFVAGGVTTDIVEKFDGDTKEDVYVKNTNNVPVYVRAQVVINWINADGNVAASVPSDYKYTMTPTTLPAQDSGWVLGDDGFYYYTKALAAVDDGTASDDDKKTSNLIDKIESTYPAETDPEYTLSVEVLTEAIQAIPDGAFNESWGTSSGLTASNGTLSETESE